MILSYENDIKLLKAEISNKNLELNQFNERYKKLNVENNNLMQEIQRFANENEKLNIIKNKGEQNNQMFYIQNQSQKIEINELNKNYNNIIKEKEKLKQNLQIFMDENKAAAEHIKKIENNLNNYEINTQKLIKDKNDLINKLNESTKKEECLSCEISHLKDLLDQKNTELIKSSLLNTNNIININNNHNNINNSVMMNNNMISDNEMINLLNQKISRISCDNKTLETKIKMYKDEKKLSQDMLQRLQYENITLKKKMEMRCENGFCQDIIDQYKRQVMRLNNEINKYKKENYELNLHKNCYNNNILNTQSTFNQNEFDSNNNIDDCELKAEQL